MNTSIKQPTITTPEIKGMIAWIARLPELGKPLRGQRGPLLRAGLERYAREYLRHSSSKPSKARTDRFTTHSFMGAKYYPLEFLRLALIDRVRQLH